MHIYFSLSRKLHASRPQNTKILLVYEISSENDASRLIDGNNYRGEAFAIIFLFLYLYPRHDIVQTGPRLVPEKWTENWTGF